MPKNISTIEITPSTKKIFIKTAKKMVELNSCVGEEVSCSNCVLHYMEGGCIEYIAKINSITRSEVNYSYAAKTARIWLIENESNQLEFDF